MAVAMRNRHSIWVTTTTHEKAARLSALGLHPAVVSFPEDLSVPPPHVWPVAEELDVVIITIPLAGRRLSVAGLSAKVAHLASFLGSFLGQMFFMSTTSVYPDADGKYAESNMPVADIESERIMRAAYPQINILRLAGLMGDNRLLKHYAVQNPHLPVNHIHYADVSAVIEKMMDRHTATQVYNIVAPLHPTKEAVISAQLGTPPKGSSPSTGRIISCHKLMADLNYTFIHPHPAMFHLCG
jgi:hypothetical protein